MKNMIFLGTFLIFASCTSFSSFYTPYFDDKTIPSEIKLKQGEEPRLFSSNNIENDGIEILSNHYVCIGYTYFNGPERDITYDIKQQCRSNGATIALYSMMYTDTRSGTISVPGQQTTTHSGSIYGSGGFGSYRGTSTTTTMNNYNYSVRRYDYIVYYFVPINTKFQFGVQWNDLNNELRLLVQRNTGVFINVVYKNTPAFYANILRGDVIVRVNENNINNVLDMTNIMNQYNSGDTIEIELIRNKQNIIVKVTLE